MSEPTNDYEDRRFEGLLREAAGDAPAPDLLQRTLAAIDEQPVTAPAPAKRRRNPAIAIAIAAAAVVTVIAWLQPGGDKTGGPDHQTLQDPKLPPAELVRQLTEEKNIAKARTQLLRHGAAAVPDLSSAIGKKETNHLQVFDLLRLLESRAVPALPAISKFILDAKVTEPALGKAFAAAAEIAPFAAEAEQEAARRAILITAFSKAGPVAPAGAVAVGGPQERTFSLRNIGRIQHRLELGGNASTERCLEALATGSPFERELAARLLRDHRDERIVPALRKALRETHPEHVKVVWQNEAGSGNFAFSHQHDPMIHLAAARSLAKLVGDAPEAAAAHAFLLRVGNLDSQRRAAVALAHTEAQPEDRDAVRNALVAANDHKDVQLLREVVTALGHYGPLPERALNRLKELTRHSDAQLRARARATVKQLSK